ncbi:MAG: antitoxin [Nanoarchaeota archaeon]|nr:antitoxin [Nanoarchaeota archaeon]|tara:strand:+ start:264 stop:521 length:258 start_codon:yes stop_codon:yes gene_type:complete
MGTKTISIMDDAYNILLSRKHENESFSEVIRKLVGKKTDIMEFAGAWKDVPDKEIEGMKKRINSIRRKATVDLLKKLEKDDMHRH